MIALAGFSPDLDPVTPGVLTDCVNVIPTDNGMQGAPSQIVAVPGLAALSAACRGSAVLMNTGGTRRHFAGTQTKLYELSGTAWADVSRTANYTGSSESRWLYDQFGNVGLASNDVEKIQWSTSGVFQDITAAPAARVMFTTDNFVFAADYNHTAAGDVPDGWWCSAYQDYTSWTTSVTTQATSGRLIGSGGPITAGWRLGPYVTLYKNTNIFLGSYVGSPVVWQFERVPGDAGCVGPEALTDIGGTHIFLGEDNFWSFDGTRPVPIGNQIRRWFFRNSNAAYRYRTIAKFDRRNAYVYFFYPSTSSTVLDKAVVYHLPTGRWGTADITVEAVVNFIGQGITWATFGTVASTWNALPDTPWDSPLWSAGSKGFAVFNSSHELKLMSGNSAGGSFTTGDFGDDTRVSRLNASRIRFVTEPTSATAQGFYKMSEGGSLNTGDTTSLSDGKFDHRQEGRFHRIAYTMTGPFEATGMVPELKASGFR